MAVSPITIPLVEDGNVTGVIDIVANKATESTVQKMKKHPFQTLFAGTVEELRTVLVENVAETSEELMEKYFEGEEFTFEEFSEGIRAGVRTAPICPVFCGSAITGAGTHSLIDGISHYAPAPQVILTQSQLQ